MPARLTIAELVTEMKGQDTFAPAFEGTGATGSGATGSGNNKAVMKGSVLQIPASNQEMINEHIDDIAAGKAIVVGE
jgi:hypothetical protein